MPHAKTLIEINTPAGTTLASTSLTFDRIPNRSAFPTDYRHLISILMHNWMQWRYR
jgi:hypothetical protein